ncbi:MAG: phage holin family protein [Pirellulaceae bacterium]
MPETPHAPVAGLADDLRGAWTEASQMVSLRRALAESELRSDLAAARGFAIVAGTCLVLAIAGVAVLAVAGAGYADHRYGFDFPWFTLATGAVLLGGGLLVGLLSWLRFRRNLLLFEQSRHELKEDLLWLEEWLGRTQDGDDENQSS